MTEHKMILASLARWRTLLVVVMKVMVTMMVSTTQRMAYWLTEQLIPLSRKKLIK